MWNKQKLFRSSWEICRDAQRFYLQMHGLTKCLLQYFRRLDSWWWTKGGQNGREGCWKPEGEDAGGQSPPAAEEAHFLFSLLISLVLHPESQFWIRKKSLRSSMICPRLHVFCVDQRLAWLSAYYFQQSTIQKISESWAVHACKLSASNLRTVQPCKGPCR